MTKDAIDQIFDRARHGDVFAQTSYGWMYFDGRGVKRDYSEAAKWYIKAASKGYSKAQSASG